MKILEFKATPGFGEYKKLFDPISIKHPAKINQNLLRYLIKNYTNEGDLILDPMAGTFSTSVMAMILNRNSIGIDLEEKFVNWGKKNIEITEKYPQLSKKGKAIVLKGDSRKLSSLLSESKEEIDMIISSPPYSSSIKPFETPEQIENRRQRLYDNIGNLPHGSVDTIISSPPYSESLEERKGNIKIRNEKGLPQPYSQNKENIGQLKHGNIDTIISSPPYADSKKGKENAEEFAKRSERSFKKEWNTGKNRHTPGRMRAQEALTSGYSEDNENIGNLPLGEVDKVGD
jgi:DNA modification methylase